ncbi:MAG: TonB family protein [Candidatus Coatesbacteria bacterium]|nr:TonB family protein [Candidatus Coatesbacteria bacterium]
MNGLDAPLAGRADPDFGKKRSPYVALSVVVHLVFASLLLSATFKGPSPASLPASLRVRLEVGPVLGPFEQEIGPPQETLEALGPQEGEAAAEWGALEADESVPGEVSNSVGEAESKSRPQLGPPREGSGEPNLGEVSAPMLRDAPVFEYPYYLNLLRGRLSDAWLYPADAASGKGVLQATMAFRICRDGRVDQVRLEESSKCEIFDRSVLRAVEAAAPFPPLPDGFKKETLGVLFVTFEYRK